MTFDIGDYVKHKEHPKSKVVLHVRSEFEKLVINANAEDYRYATEEEKRSGTRWNKCALHVG